MLQRTTYTIFCGNGVCGWIGWIQANCNLVLRTRSALLWRHNGHDGVSNHQSHDCLHNHSFRRRSKKISKLRVTGLYAGNSPVTNEFPAQMTINAENVSIWWRHRVESCTIFNCQEKLGDSISNVTVNDVPVNDLAQLAVMWSVHWLVRSPFTKID